MDSEAVDKGLQWGAGASVSLGGLLWALAVGQAGKARKLQALPHLENAADLARMAAKPGALETGTLVAASGLVKAAEVLEDTLCKKPAAAAVVTQEELSRRRSGSAWHEDSRLVRLSKRVGPLALQLGHELVQLRPGSSREVEQVLEPSVTISTPVRQGLMQQAIDTTFGYVVSAYVEKEFILPEGAQLTAVGLLTHESRGLREGFALEPARGGGLELSRGSLQDRVRGLTRFSRGLKTAALCFGAAGAALLAAWLLRRHLRRQQEKQWRAAQQRNLAEVREWRAAQQAGGGRPAAAGGGGAAGEGEAWRCCVCWEAAEHRMVFPACGHAAVCGACGPRLRACPMCRKPSRPVLLFLD